VKALPEVDAASGIVQDEAKLIDRDGDIISSGGAPALAFGIDHAEDQRFNPLSLVEGTWPAGGGQMVIDRKTSDKANYSVGDTIGVSTEDGVRQFEITGIANFAGVSSIGGATISVFDVPTAQELFHKAGKYDEVQVAAKDGVSPQQLTNDIRPLLPATAQVRTSDAQVHESTEETNGGLGILQKVLLAFAGIALFVGSFVIANTLSITIAQRGAEAGEERDQDADDQRHDDRSRLEDEPALREVDSERHEQGVDPLRERQTEEQPCQGCEHADHERLHDHRGQHLPA
jgi:putative ABC transport system permease protein